MKKLKKMAIKKTVFLWYFSFGIFPLRQNCHVICYKNFNCAFSLSSGFVEVGGNKYVPREDRTGDECQDYYDNCFYKKDGELYSGDNDSKSKRVRKGRVIKRRKHVDRRRERSYSFQGTLQHRKVLSLATALVGPRTVTPVNTALLRRTAWSIGL